ncbi:hypothetical protein SAMN05192529_13623 [Arachidicoccus rhizosphaerae]|jgi:hypothetical protein|uniref:Lipocalin-like domain-containing protein n=1 Tax=Arachidicoccus rhizosphaerae TaxID=551991 RepID=A0A1H4CTM9_9BACT|nr:hypothetical protein [Arachidicoccus rhizosphaerae]SEA63664.1 hypothetical protein SAMN05192529_13623 [Arachidicoccus rhizosphaerae]
MRKYGGLLFGVIFFFAGCSKEQVNKITICPVEPTVYGKWAIKDIEGLEAVEFAAGYKPNQDTILMGSDGKYYFINQGDTTDFGEFTLGHNEAVNGFGRIQAYDSIIYQSSRMLTNDAPQPAIFYFKIGPETLDMSPSYYKDSSNYKFIIHYIRP